MESSAAVAHRKLELQDPEDLTYLIDNVRRAAADSINAAFPPVEGAEGEVDELRIRIEELVNEVHYDHDLILPSVPRPITTLTLNYPSNSTSCAHFPSPDRI